TNLDRYCGNNPVTRWDPFGLGSGTPPTASEGWTAEPVTVWAQEMGAWGFDPGELGFPPGQVSMPGGNLPGGKPGGGGRGGRGRGGTPRDRLLRAITESNPFDNGGSIAEF